MGIVTVVWAIMMIIADQIMKRPDKAAEKAAG